MLPKLGKANISQPLGVCLREHFKIDSSGTYSVPNCIPRKRFPAEPWKM